MPDRPPHDKDVAIKVAVSASLALAFMLVDFVLLIRDEAKYVWPRLRGSWTARIYMLARYVGLSSQIYNVYFTVRMSLGVYTSPRGCLIWFMYQAAVVQFLLLFAEGLLIRRTYALFLRNRFILMILISFVLGQVASMGVSARLAFPTNKHTVTCMMVRTNPGSAFFSATMMTTNAIIFFMTFWRFFQLPVNWTHGDVGHVVMRDSALSLSAIIVMMMFLTLCSLKVIKPAMGGNITYYWLIFILWVSIGRIIVNHEKLPRDEAEQGDSDIWKGTLQLTSQIEMGESVLSLDTQSSDAHTPTSGTLQTSFSTPVTKPSQLSPLSACPSDSSRGWLGDHIPSYGRRRRHSPQPPSTEPSMELSTPSDGDAAQTKDSPQSDAEERVRSCPSPQPPSPRPSNSEPPPQSEVPS